MALEDAVSFETFFSAANFDPAVDSVTKRLELWNSFRMPRDCGTQLLSNAMIFNKPVDEARKKI